jgi:hypothetical protein
VALASTSSAEGREQRDISWTQGAQLTVAPFGSSGDQGKPGEPELF